MPCSATRTQTATVESARRGRSPPQRIRLPRSLLGPKGFGQIRCHEIVTERAVHHDAGEHRDSAPTPPVIPPISVMSASATSRAMAVSRSRSGTPPRSTGRQPGAQQRSSFARGC